jgi:hypothetical protein
MGVEILRNAQHDSEVVLPHNGEASVPPVVTLSRSEGSLSLAMGVEKLRNAQHDNAVVLQFPAAAPYLFPTQYCNIYLESIKVFDFNCPPQHQM